jgi:hypothetical protein
MNSKVKSKLIIFFDIKRIVYKEIFMVVQILLTTVTFYGGGVKTSRRTLAAAKELAIASQKNTASHQELLTKNNTSIVPHPTKFSLFPRLKLELKDHHFDTIEAIVAESQKVLNILTE